MLADDRAVDARPPPGVELLAPTTDEELHGVRQVQHEAYDDPDAVDDAAIARLRRNLAGGAGAVLARTIDDGEPAGAGEYTVADRRRLPRSPASASGRLAPTRDRRGDDVAAARGGASGRRHDAVPDGEWADESRVYARVGFATIVAVLHISR